jgi:alpha-galactosidase
MITVKGDKNPLFILDTGHTTYAMKVLDTGHIEHLYYGRKIHMDDADGLIGLLDEGRKIKEEVDGV